MDHSRNLEDYLEILFKIRRRNSTIQQELYGGIIQYLSIVKVLAVNPSQLSRAGYEKANIVTGTAFAIAITCFLTGIFGNLPFICAPTLPTAIYLTITMRTKNIDLPTGNTIVFFVGLLLMLCTLRKLADILKYLMPNSIQIGICLGVCLMVSLEALAHVGLVVRGRYSVLEMGNMWNDQALIAMSMFILIGALCHYKVQGAYVYGMLLGSILSWWINDSWPREFISPIKLSFSLNMNPFHPSSVLTPLEFSLIVLDLFIISSVKLGGLTATLASLAGIDRKTDSSGFPPRSRWLYFSCGVGSLLSAVMGAGPVLLSAETAVAIMGGARTGLSTILCGFLFLLSAPFYPLWAAIPPAGTGPVLLMTSVIIFGNSAKVDWGNISEGMVVFSTAIICGFTCSIFHGVIFGSIVYIAMKAVTGELYTLLREEGTDTLLTIHSRVLACLHSNSLFKSATSYFTPTPSAATSPSTSFSSSPLFGTGLPLFSSPFTPRSYSYQSISEEEGEAEGGGGGGGRVGGPPIHPLNTRGGLEIRTNNLEGHSTSLSPPSPPLGERKQFLSDSDFILSLSLSPSDFGKQSFYKGKPYHSQSTASSSQSTPRSNFRKNEESFNEIQPFLPTDIQQKQQQQQQQQQRQSVIETLERNMLEKRTKLTKENASDCIMDNDSSNSCGGGGAQGCTPRSLHLNLSSSAMFPLLPSSFPHRPPTSRKLGYQHEDLLHCSDDSSHPPHYPHPHIHHPNHPHPHSHHQNHPHPHHQQHHHHYHHPDTYLYEKPSFPHPCQIDPLLISYSIDPRELTATHPSPPPLKKGEEFSTLKMEKIDQEKELKCSSKNNCPNDPLCQNDCPEMKNEIPTINDFKSCLPLPLSPSLPPLTSTSFKSRLSLPPLIIENSNFSPCSTSPLLSFPPPSPCSAPSPSVFPSPFQLSSPQFTLPFPPSILIPLSKKDWFAPSSESTSLPPLTPHHHHSKLKTQDQSPSSLLSLQVPPNPTTSSPLSSNPTSSPIPNDHLSLKDSSSSSPNQSIGHPSNTSTLPSHSFSWNFSSQLNEHHPQPKYYQQPYQGFANTPSCHCSRALHHSPKGSFYQEVGSDGRCRPNFVSMESFFEQQEGKDYFCQRNPEFTHQLGLSIDDDFKEEKFLMPNTTSSNPSVPFNSHSSQHFHQLSHNSPTNTSELMTLTLPSWLKPNSYSPHPNANSSPFSIMLMSRATPFSLHSNSSTDPSQTPTPSESTNPNLKSKQNNELKQTPKVTSLNSQPKRILRPSFFGAEEIEALESSATSTPTPGYFVEEKQNEFDVPPKVFPIRKSLSDSFINVKKFPNLKPNLQGSLFQVSQNSKYDTDFMPLSEFFPRIDDEEKNSINSSECSGFSLEGLSPKTNVGLPLEELS